jgi:hypothetical protein
VCAACVHAVCVRQKGGTTDQQLETWVAVYDAGYDVDVGSAVLGEGETVNRQEDDDKKAPVCLRRTTVREPRFGRDEDEVDKL